MTVYFVIAFCVAAALDYAASLFNQDGKPSRICRAARLASGVICIAILVGMLVVALIPSPTTAP